MKRNKLLLVLFLPMLLLLPFGNYAHAQVPNYVGVDAGDQYTWDVQIQFGNVDTLLANVKDVLVDWQANINSLDLFGLESLTIAEIYEQIAVAYISIVLPVGWESLNITDLVTLTITDYVENFNATFLSGMIPSNWLSLNFSDFYDLAFEGINATLFATGWENDPLPELYKMAFNELNSTILYGLLPAGWETMTLGDFFSTLLIPHLPVLWESLVIQTMIASVMSFLAPPGMSDYTLNELIDELMLMLPSEISSLNASALFENMFFGINQTMPGIESENMTVVLDNIGDMVNSTLPSGYGALNMSSLLDIGIEALVNMTLPVELHGLTIVDILDMGFTEAINMFDLNILPGWAEAYTMFQGMGMTSIEAGLRVIINSLGTEIESYPGGPKGVPIDMDIFVSYDSAEWLNMSEMLGMTGGFSLIGLFLNSYMFGFSMFEMPILAQPTIPPGSPIITITPLIVDPTTYSIVQTALSDQFLFTGTLIVANNYNWANVQTDLTMVTPGNPDAIVMSTAWTSKGVLQQADIKTDGLVVASITLIGAEEAEEIPGFEIPIILGISSVAFIAIIYHIKRKNKIIK